MDWLEFVASLVSSLAWPAVVVIAIWLFREPLGGLVTRLTQWEGLGVRAQFIEKLDDVAGVAGEVADEAREKLAELDPARVVALDEPAPVDTSDEPAFVIIAAWEQLGAAVAELAVTADLASGRTNSNPRSVARALRAAGVVNDLFVRSVDDLAALRDLVAHGRHRPTRGEADEFLRVTRELTRGSAALGQFYTFRPDGPGPLDPA